MDALISADILIAGVGHALMGDDGLGPAVIKRLEEDDLPSRVRLLDAGPAPQEILTELSGIKKLIVIDALAGVASGTMVVKRFPARCALPGGDSGGDGTVSHGLGLVQTLCIARGLFPEIEILVIGAGIVPAAVPGMQLSDSLRQRIPSLIALIHEELRLTVQHR
jgi:hydrogenase maturation protease